MVIPATNKSDEENSTSLDTARFIAALNMAKIHEHKIYTLNEISDNVTMIFNGTSTVTLQDGPVHNVRTLITTMAGNVISNISRAFGCE